MFDNLSIARVCLIPDLHSPWVHPRALDFILQTVEQWKCDRIILAGDEIDAHAFSKYTQHPDLPSAHDELELAIEYLEPFYDAFDEAVVLESNHGSRIFKKAHGAGLPSRILRNYEEILHYPPGWKLQEIQLELDGVIYVHGDSFNQSSWKSAFNRMRASVVMGHLHSGAGVCYSQSRSSRLFAMNAGCLIDPRQKCFDYARNSIERATLGCGVIIDGEQALFIPMPDKMQNDFR